MKNDDKNRWGDDERESVARWDKEINYVNIEFILDFKVKHTHSQTHNSMKIINI